MFDPASHNSVGRFDGLAGVYDRHRPHYPESALDFLLEHCGLRPGMRVVDVGSGTGISSRQLAARGLEVIGVEPNAQMRVAADAVPVPAGATAPRYVDGRADATGLPDGVAAVVMAAQAFHWFPYPAALREFYRVLQPEGWVALIWNEQDRGDPFTEAYGKALQRHSPNPEIAAMSQCASGEHLLTCPLFRDGERFEFPHSQTLDLEQLLGRAFSASFAPRETDGRRQLEQSLGELYRQSQSADGVVMRYRTTLYLARRATPK